MGRRMVSRNGVPSGPTLAFRKNSGKGRCLEEARIVGSKAGRPARKRSCGHKVIRLVKGTDGKLKHVVTVALKEMKEEEEEEEGGGGGGGRRRRRQFGNRTLSSER